MKMIWAVLRPASVQPVLDALLKAGIAGLVRMTVSREGRSPAGPGGEPGAELHGEMIMMVLPDNEVAKAVIAIRAAAKITGDTDATGGPDDFAGFKDRILVTYVDDFYPIRTARGLPRGSGV